ncbi:S9 family peptidase [Belliella sp. DSM 107340]|uniref:S9 family peptidase n=1 Tax=Belliella calami TaxID=2923436 RepID=A0ABS9URU0_9BACT|nr:DPP IV N-terminal domain-containing protein [Belliella calami]MCH7399238.1 S9 family peptidase [Belliella calami]
MKIIKNLLKFSVLICLLFCLKEGFSQNIIWHHNDLNYFKLEENQIIRYELPGNEREVFLNSEKLTPLGSNVSLTVRDFAISKDENSILIYTNTKKVWRLDTQGDYWIYDVGNDLLRKIGESLPESSLRFAKIDPTSKNIAYVSGSNLYYESISDGKITQLTHDGNRKLINGTFDWAYEEEFACRDGFQWSPDGKLISFWQINAEKIRDFYMVNNTDSVYSQVIPVEYPKVGYSPSPAKIGVIDLESEKLDWLPIPGDPAQHYLPRMEWNSANTLLVQQLNRKQNESKIFKISIPDLSVVTIHKETDPAWIDVLSSWDNVYGLTFRHEFKWINKGKEFLWMSEKDGWKHIYRIDMDGKEKLITKGAFDVMNLLGVDQEENWIYFHASPENATQKYLYRTRIDGKGKLEKVTPEGLEGLHHYEFSPNAAYAIHQFQNNYTQPIREWISLPKHEVLNQKESISQNIASKQHEKKVEFFQISIDDKVTMDGWMVKPNDFDKSKKYPVVFYVYTEPWGANVKDGFGSSNNRLYDGDMAEDGYIYISIDNRGTPVPKGREWRKSIYRKVGQLNISDQAAAAKQIAEWDFVDPDRIAVWGWSGGGSATLNLLFQYPEIYKTGIAIAAVADQLTYDNIYQERYMGLPQENLQDFIDGSPVTHARNLKGNLLYIHGTGDDNVHYANADILVNELIKHGKLFQIMPYPNRSHSISEGSGTTAHLRKLFTDYLKKHCPPGGI